MFLLLFAVFAIAKMDKSVLMFLLKKNSLIFPLFWLQMKLVPEGSHGKKEMAHFITTIATPQRPRTEEI